MDSPKNAMAIVVAMSVALPILYVMRRTGSPTLAGNLIAAAFFGVMTVQACRLGGHQSLILPWYATVPVVVLSTAGRRSALCWLVVISWSLAAFYAISEMGYSLPNDLPPHHYELLRLLVWVGLGVLFLVLALLYEQAKNQTLAELQAAETNLRQERNFSDLAIASMPGIFYLFDSKGRFLRWNDNFERVSGYTADELSGLRLLDLFRNPDRGIMAQSVQDVFTKGQATPEASLMTKAGTAIPYLFSGRRILIDGKPHVIGMGMDIAARKQNEAAMQEAKDQADANAKRAEQALTDVGRLNAVMMGRAAASHGDEAGGQRVAGRVGPGGEVRARVGGRRGLSGRKRRYPTRPRRTRDDSRTAIQPIGTRRVRRRVVAARGQLGQAGSAPPADSVDGGPTGAGRRLLAPAWCTCSKPTWSDPAGVN